MEQCQRALELLATTSGVDGGGDDEEDDDGDGDGGTRGESSASGSLRGSDREADEVWIFVINLVSRCLSKKKKNLVSRVFLCFVQTI